MSSWRIHARAHPKAMVQVPLAATYLAVRLLQAERENDGLLDALLKHLRTTLASCPSRERSVLSTLEAARCAAIPLDRSDVDCLFAAGALADGSVKNRAFCSTELLLGLGYLDLERSQYVATLADRKETERLPALPFLPPGGFEELQLKFPPLKNAVCGLLTHDGSPTLFALEFDSEKLGEVRQGLEDALATADGAKLECRLYVRAAPSRTGPKIRLYSAAQLAMQPLPDGKFALSHAAPEWLMGLHACSMQEAWLYLACSTFRMLCRVPDISATSALVPAVGFSPHQWFLRYLGIPETCSAYVPHKLAITLAQRYPWFAATDPLVWLESIGAPTRAPSYVEGIGFP